MDHRGSRAQFALMEPPQPPNGHRSQSLSRLQAIDLGGIEGQAGQGRAPQRRREIASPALLLEPRALFEFAIGIILYVPAWTIGEASPQTHRRTGAYSPRPLAARRPTRRS